MTQEIIQTMEAALQAQFNSGKLIGRLETLIDQAMPKLPEPTVDKASVET
jgi:hypothetical protein